MGTNDLQVTVQALTGVPRQSLSFGGWRLIFFNIGICLRFRLEVILHGSCKISLSLLQKKKFIIKLTILFIHTKMTMQSTIVSMVLYSHRDHHHFVDNFQSPPQVLLLSSFPIPPLLILLKIHTS